MKRGWQQIGFVSDFESAITPVYIGRKPYMVIRQEADDGYTLYEATCPHRGANLAMGGELVPGGIVCPFHGCVVGLECTSEEGYQVKKHPLLVVDGLLFTQQADSPDHGFGAFMETLSDTHVIIPGFCMEVNVEPELVIENAFDQLHFRTVHNILNEPRFEVVPRADNALAVTGTFVLPPSPWQSATDAPGAQQAIPVPYEAIAFSPYTVVSTLLGSNPYYIITATCSRGQATAIYLSIGIPLERFEEDELELYKYLIAQSYKGLEKDKVIWEHLDREAIQRYRPEERSVIAFRQFCKRFQHAP